MSKYAHLKHVVSIAFILLLFPALSIAASLDLSPSSNDYSHAYLRALFGTVENVFTGTGSQVVGAMFKTFNSAVLTIGGFVLMYILVVSTINTAHSGQVLGEKWSSVWVPMRAALGIALLLPKASGYCLIQTLLMWIIVQGIGAADRVWEQALDYLGGGGVLISSGSGSGGNTNITHADQELFKNFIKGYAVNYLKIAACMQAVEAELRKKSANNANASVPSFETTIEFSLEKIQQTQDAPGAFPGSYEGYTQAYQGACGSIRIGGVMGSSAGAKNANTVVILAHEQMYSEMSRIARRYVDNNYQAIADSEVDAVIGTGVEFFFLLRTAMQYVNASSGDSTRDFIQRAKEDGWLLAGTYFYELTALKKSNVQM